MTDQLHATTQQIYMELQALPGFDLPQYQQLWAFGESVNSRWKATISFSLLFSF